MKMIICDSGSVHGCQVGHFGSRHNLLALGYSYSLNSCIECQAQHFHFLLLGLPLHLLVTQLAL